MHGSILPETQGPWPLPSPEWPAWKMALVAGLLTTALVGLTVTALLGPLLRGPRPGP